MQALSTQFLLKHEDQKAKVIKYKKKTKYFYSSSP